MTKRRKLARPEPSRKLFSGQGAKTVDRRASTADGFANLAMKLGVVAPGEEGCETNLLSRGHYQFNLLTRNRIQLEAAYRGSWIVGRMVDCVAEDMTKSGIIANTNDGAKKIQKFKAGMSQLKIWKSLRETVQWGRLYGGAIGVYQIEGQDLSTPLDIETIGRGDFRGIAVYDRWQLNPVLTEIIEDGPDIGLPAYYDIVLGSNMNDPGQVPGGQSQTKVNENSVRSEGNKNSNSEAQMTGQTAGGPAASRVRVHHSRCFVVGGHKLPFFQAITEMMWDESIIERVWDRLIEFDTATASAGGLIGRALLRTVGIDGLREILAAGGEAETALISMFDHMRQFQTNEGLTLLDKNDSFDTTAYSFAGLADVLIQFGQQVSGASETPLVRLFGQSPVGLSATGDSDIRNYYDSINSKQELHLRDAVEVITQILWRSLFGENRPEDFTFIFTPLWQMSAKEKAEIVAQLTTAILAAHDSGVISTAIAMKELKQQSADTGIFTHITDEDVADAENEAPPMPDVDPENPNAEPGELGEGPREPKELVAEHASGVPISPGAKDSRSLWRRIRDYITKNGSKYVVHAESGKVMGRENSKAAAEKRLREIEYFKHNDERMTDEQKAIRDYVGDAEASDARRAIRDYLAS